MNGKTLKLAVSLTIIVITASSYSYAQRVVCDVKVTLEKMPLENQTKLTFLQSELANYMNIYDWTENEFKYNLNCQLEVAFSEAKTISYEDRYVATIVISNGVDLQYADKRWEFSLRQDERLEHSETFHPFTSLIDFYNYLILAHEYDKLYRMGGDRYLDMANQINESAKFDVQYYKGWDRRSDIINTLRSEERKEYRKLIYYYFTGIYFYDQKDKKKAVQFLSAALEQVKKVSPDVLKRFFEVNYYALHRALKSLKLEDKARSIEKFAPES